MTNIKRGTTPTIMVQIDGITPADAEKIEFVFKHQMLETAHEICYKAYPGAAVTFDAENGCFLIAFSDEETRAFVRGNTVYMDTRIIFPDGSIPATEIVRIGVTETLFQRSVV